MQVLGSVNVAALAVGAGLGVFGFAPLLAIVGLVRSRRVRPTVPKGIAAVAASFIVLMTAFTAIWLVSPRDILVVAIGFLLGFPVMCAVLAAMTMSR